MGSFEVISLDMFQTLVNVESRREQIWKRILQESYTYEIACEHGRSLLSQYIKPDYIIKSLDELFQIVV